MPKARYYVKQPDHIRLFFLQKTSQPSKAVAMLDEERTLLAKRWPEMAAKIQKRLLAEGKITKEMIES